MKLNVSVGAPPILSQSMATYIHDSEKLSLFEILRVSRIPTSNRNIRQFRSVGLRFFTGQNYHTLWKGFFNKDTSSNKSTENERAVVVAVVLLLV